MTTDRPMSKRALAQLYYPGDKPRTAVKKFHAEISQTPSLLRALSATGYDPAVKNRYFFPVQLRLIVRYLGEP